MKPGRKRRPRKALPDWRAIYRELKSPSITLKLLWSRYRQEVAEPYEYQPFWKLHKDWLSGLNLLMRDEEEHKYGEKVFTELVESGTCNCLPVYVVDYGSGEARPVVLFVAVLGGSLYSYAEARLADDIETWVSCHLNAFHAFGGVCKYLISKSSHISMESHSRCQEMAFRFKTRLSEGKGDVACRLVRRWLARVLSRRHFRSLDELNEVLFDLIEDLNRRPFTKLSGSRGEWFDSFERGNLIPLPASIPEAVWLWVWVDADNLVPVAEHYYSVPHQLVGQKVRIRMTQKKVDVYYRGKPVASHRRSYVPGKSTTLKKHGGKLNQVARGWTPERVLKWAQTVGPAATHAIRTILTNAGYSQMGVRSCLGILSLEKEHGREKLETACRYALSGKSWSVRTVRSLLARDFDRLPQQLTIPDFPFPFE